MVGFSFGLWDVADLGEESPVVVPIDPFQGSLAAVGWAIPWPRRAAPSAVAHELQRLPGRGAHSAAVAVNAVAPAEALRDAWNELTAR
jgi:hypothetical protein